MIYYIYVIINTINNKTYVGYTNKQNPNDRWKNHLRAVKYLNRPLYKAMIKYGVEKFKFKVIYCSKDGTHTLNVMESYFIKQYNSFITNCGYNLTRGGESNVGWVPTDETRQLWSSQRKGRTLSIEHKNILSIIQKKRYQDNPEIKTYYRRLALERGARPPIPTPESHKKGAITRTGKHIHTPERKQMLSDLFLTNSHPFQQPDAMVNRKITWKTNMRGQGSKNGNATFCKVYQPNEELYCEGHLREICIQFNLPFNKFLAAARHGNPLERGDWKGWRIEKITRDYLMFKN